MCSCNRYTWQVIGKKKMIELFDKNMNLNYKKTTVKCTFIEVNEKNSCLPPDTDRQSLTDCLMDCFFPPNKYEFVNYLRFFNLPRIWILGKIQWFEQRNKLKIL